MILQSERSNRFHSCRHRWFERNIQFISHSSWQFQFLVKHCLKALHFGWVIEHIFSLPHSLTDLFIFPSRLPLLTRSNFILNVWNFWNLCRVFSSDEVTKLRSATRANSFAMQMTSCSVCRSIRFGRRRVLLDLHFHRRREEFSYYLVVACCIDAIHSAYHPSWLPGPIL